MALYKDKYEQIEFEFEGRQSIIVLPENPRADRAFIWRTEFLGAFDTVDRAMLDRGYFLVYHRVSNMYGCPESLVMLKAFQDYIAKEYHLTERAILFGFSRGGLYAFNYARAYKDSVRLLYLDAPVLDIRSWPGKKYGEVNMPNDSKEWKECRAWYNIEDENAENFKDSPKDHINDINIPIIICAGLKDSTVPYNENGELFEKNYKGKIKVIKKPECDHHPHSLENPKEIVEFIESNI